MWADCPVCGKPKDKFSLNLETGLWSCVAGKCGATGNLWKLATILGVRVREKTLVRGFNQYLKTGQHKPRRKPKNAPGLNLDTIRDRHARLWDPDDEDGQAVLAYLRGRGFDDDTIRHFLCGVAYLDPKRKKKLAVGLPCIDGDRVTCLKMRNIDPDCAKGDRYRRVEGGESALFHVDGIRDRKKVILVEGEFDAMAVYQAGFTAVASTVLGAKPKMSNEWLEVLMPADDIVLWYDEDQAGQEAVEGLVPELGTLRCRIAAIPDAAMGKDANALLTANDGAEQIRQIIEAAPPVAECDVVEPSAFNEMTMAEFQVGEESLGIPTGYGSLDRIIRGWRPKELTVITGHTSHGKTTWATHAAGHVARNGHPVLMMSLENGPADLARKIFQRIVGMPLSVIKSGGFMDRAMAALDNMDANPIWILNRYGRQRYADIADVIRYAKSRLGIEFVLIDHLSFISKDPGDRTEEREHIDRVCMDLVALAHDLNIHIWLIAHPRGSTELTTVPTLESIKGSSSVKQIAYNGISVYRTIDSFGDSKKGKIKLKDASGRRMEIDLDRTDALIYVCKARHEEAREGATVLRFDGRNLSYKEIKEPEPDAPHGDDEAAYDEDEQELFPF